MGTVKTHDKELAELGWELSPAEAEVVRMVAKAGEKPLDEVASMFDAHRRGESCEEYFNFSPEVLNSIEGIALSLYRQKRYEEARSVFKAVVDLGILAGWARAEALRGMAACDHAQGYYIDAIFHYEAVLNELPQDLISMMALADCLCLAGDSHAGLQVAAALLKLANPRKDSSFIARAKALIAAGGGKPVANPTRVRPQPGQASSAAPAAAPGAAAGPGRAPHPAAKPGPQTQGPADKQVREALDEVQSAGENIAMDLSGMPQEAREFFEQPESKAMLAELVQMVGHKRITIREIADFSDEQMEASYTLACQTLGQGDALRAAQMAGWLSYIDSREPKYYRLAGLCMHNLKLWCAADYFYNVCTIWQQGRQDPTTQFYQGEVKLMLGERAEGIAMLEAGVAAAQGKHEFSSLVKRGQTLLKQLASSKPADSKPSRP